MTNRRIAGGAGVLFVAMNVIAALAPGAPPAFNDPIEKLVKFAVEKDSQIVAGSFVAAISSFFALMFFVGLWRILRQAEGDGFDFSTVALAGGVAAVAVVTVGSALMAVPSFESEQLGPPSNEIVRFASDAAGLSFVLLGGILIVILLGAAISILRSRALPAWLGVLGLVAAAAEVVGTLGITKDSLYKAGLALVFMPLMVWVLAASITLFTSQDRTGAA